MNDFQQDIQLIRSAQLANFNPDICITAIGHLKSNGDFRWNSFVSKIAVHFIISGRGIMNYNGIEYSVSQGDWFIFWPDKQIKYYDFPATPWEYYWFHLDGNRAVETMVAAGLSPETPHLPNSQGSKLFLTTLHHATTRIRHNSYPKCYAVSLAWLLMERLSMEAENSMDTTPTPSLAEDCRMIIENSLAQRLSVNDLARQLKVNRATLFRVFKRRFGLSPKTYIDNLRFELACKMLKKSSDTIKEIAYACGFEEQHYFSLAFRKRFGMSPSCHRSRNAIGKKQL